MLIKELHARTMCVPLDCHARRYLLTGKVVCDACQRAEARFAVNASTVVCIYCLGLGPPENLPLKSPSNSTFDLVRHQLLSLAESVSTPLDSVGGGTAYVQGYLSGVVLTVAHPWRGNLAAMPRQVDQLYHKLHDLSEAGRIPTAEELEDLARQAHRCREPGA